MKKIDGRSLAANIKAEIKQEIINKKLKPKLAVLLVGEDPASHLYVSLKEKAAAEVGIETIGRNLPASSTTSELVSIIKSWNNDPNINGILVQLPLPTSIDEDLVISAISPQKDADGFHPENLKALFNGQGKIIPPVHEGILRLIAATDLSIKDAQATIIANSETFASPLAYLLRRAGAVVEAFLPNEINRAYLKNSQIIIVAVGQMGLITSDLVQEGACLIDVGTNKKSDGKICGDVDTVSMENISGWLSPVPGGVGPMTIALLLKNVVNLTTQV